MQESKKAKKMADYLGCLSQLEYNTALLYKGLSEKTEIPLARSLLLSIAQDSSKHSALLKGIGDSISVSNVNSKDCSRMLGQTWQIVTNYLNEVSKNKERVSLADLCEKLMVFESGVGEEYYIFVQMQTLQHLTKEINELYNVNLSTVKNIFESIIRDEDHHRELLATIKELNEHESKDNNNTPIVKYQNPDRWINYTPNNF